MISSGREDVAMPGAYLPLPVRPSSTTHSLPSLELAVPGRLYAVRLQPGAELPVIAQVERRGVADIEVEARIEHRGVASNRRAQHGEARAARKRVRRARRPRKGMLPAH